MLEICLKLNINDKIPLYMQIYNHIKAEILSGNIPSETKLPSIRSLATHLKLSKNTIEAAYSQLITEGYVKSRNRSGLYVEKIEKDFVSLVNDYPILSKEKKDKPQKPSIRYDFRTGQIDVDFFPYNVFRKNLIQCVDEYSSELLLYGEHKGDPGLRQEIAKYLHSSRGVICSPEQILVSSGTQQSLTLLSHILSKLYNRYIAFEEPGYSGAAAVFKHFDFEVIPITLEDDGINIDLLKESNAKVVYVTPSHQFPYGMVMPISKRLKLLQWAIEKDGIIIEDDYDSEFRYKGKPIPSLQGLDDRGRVVYIGGFSKSLMPSMRISYMVLPETLLNIYETQYKIYEQPVSRFLQKSLEIFMNEGHWEKHLRKLRLLYKRKQEILLNCITEHLGSNVTIIGADSGLHILLKINTKIKEADLVEIAMKAGINVSPTSIYWINPPVDAPPIILLGFARINIEDIPKGIKALKECWFK